MSMAMTKIEQQSINMASELYTVSYNMHGINQGIDVACDLVNSNNSPDVILLQEHWLTPGNLPLFGENIDSLVSLQ